MQSWWVHIVPHYRKGKAAGTKPDQRLWGPGQTTKWEEGTLWGSRNALKLGRAGGDGGGWWHGHMHLSEHTDLNTKTASFYYMWIIIRFYKLKHTWNRKNEIQVSTCTPVHTQCCRPPLPSDSYQKEDHSESQWNKRKKMADFANV